MSVTLENTTKNPRRMVTLNLTKGSAPVRLTRLAQVRTRKGGIGTKIVKTVVPGSVHIACGVTSDPLPDSVLDAPEVKKAIAQGKIRSILVDGKAAVVETVIEAPKLAGSKRGDFKVSEEPPGSSKMSTKGASSTSKKKNRQRG